MAESDPGYVFFVTQIGSPGTPQRQRSDDVLTGIVRPVATEFGLRAVRGDDSAVPGQVGIQIIKDLVGARLVVADLFDRNANAYYELGIAHTRRIPTIVLVDKVESLAFDAAGERVVPIGDDGTKIGIGEAEKAKEALRGFFRTVLSESFVPENLVTAAGVALQVEDMSERGDAVAREVSTLRESIDTLAARLDVHPRAAPLRSDLPPPNLDWTGAVLPLLKPLARAIYAAATLSVIDTGMALVKPPNDAHAVKCRQQLPALLEALKVATGSDWSVHVDVAPPWAV